MSNSIDRALQASAGRRARGEIALQASAERVMNAVGLSEERCVALAVSPEDRNKLKGILQRLARQKHPFSQCMRDLAKHRSDLPEESRKRICGRLKSMVTGTGKAKALSMGLSEDGACALLDDATIKMLMAVDDEALAAIAGPDQKEEAG